MGLPEDVASTRINRYEKDVHAPDIETAERMAQELGVPIAYLLTQDERLASAILLFSELGDAEQDKVLAELKALSGKKKDRK
jgi:transcriptional regulator with XRE-family HTH domain